MLGTGLAVAVAGIGLLVWAVYWDQTEEQRRVDMYLERRSDQGGGRALRLEAAASGSPPRR
jgi:hypothetical protein